jgi:hypothetical protein
MWCRRLHKARAAPGAAAAGNADAGDATDALIGNVCSGYVVRTWPTCSAWGLVGPSSARCGRSQRSKCRGCGRRRGCNRCIYWQGVQCTQGAHAQCGTCLHVVSMAAQNQSSARCGGSDAAGAADAADTTGLVGCVVHTCHTCMLSAGACWHMMSMAVLSVAAARCGDGVYYWCTAALQDARVVSRVCAAAGLHRTAVVYLPVAQCSCWVLCSPRCANRVTCCHSLCIKRIRPRACLLACLLCVQPSSFHVMYHVLLCSSLFRHLLTMWSIGVWHTI